MEARLCLALAALAAYATSAYAQSIVVPWTNRGSVYPTRQIACGTNVNYLWNGMHELEQTIGSGCSAPAIKNYGTTDSGNVTVYYAYPGSYEYKCDYKDHCSKGKQLLTVQVGECPAGPNTLPWSYRRDGATYAPVVVPCGTSLTFMWNTTGRHDVVQVAAANCNATVVKTLSELVPIGNATVSFPSRGSFHYMCAAPNHCAVGKMLINIRVTGMCPGEKKPVARPPPRSMRPPPRSMRSPPMFRGIVVKG